MRFSCVIVAGIFIFIQALKAGETITGECPRYEEKCKSGECIESSRFCDEVKDCADNSDEEDCDSRYCDEKVSFLCKSGECISQDKVCDGNNDCHNDDDEEHCEGVDCSGKFACSNGRCIPMIWHCDGMKDCKDNSDETNCTTSDTHCPISHFTCKNMKCISHVHRCDEKIDCEDGDDEEHCGDVDLCFEKNGYFLCKDNKTCLHVNALCNGKTDCEDGSDEGGKCEQKCETECEHNCYPTPSGPKCSCMKGYKLVADGRCEDVDECNLETAVCDHFCTNTPGDFNCTCDVGYHLINKTSCICSKEGPAMMVISVGNGIKAMFMDGRSNAWNVFKGNKKIRAVAYDPVEKNVYWVANNAIYRKPMIFNILLKSDRGEIRDSRLMSGYTGDHRIHTSELFLQQLGSLEADSIAMDWFGRNLYVTDSKNNHLLVCSLYFRNCKVLLQDIASPRSIVLDLENRYLYYSDVVKGTIEKVSMDGSSRKTIIENNLDWPNGIALDPPAQRLYWLDAQLDAAESTNYEGQDRKQLPQADVRHPHSLGVWESKLYWTEWSNRGKKIHKSIHSCRKIDGRNQTIIYRNALYAVNFLTIYHSSMFQNVFNPCKQAKCSDICLLSPNMGYSCACPLEMQLNNDGHTCEEVSSVKMFTAVSDVEGLKFMTISPRYYGIDEANVVQVRSVKMDTISRISFNPTNNVSYMIDGKSGLISALNMSTMQLSSIYETNDIITAICVDFARNYIYYTAGFSSHVAVLNPEKKITTVLEVNTISATDLAVDVMKRYLFISDNGMVILQGYICRCNLAGEKCTKIIENIRQPSSLAVDQGLLQPRLYWASKYDGRIWSSAYDGHARIPIKEDIMEPMIVSVGAKYIFWLSNKGNFYGTVDKETYSKSKLTPKEAISEGKILTIETLYVVDFNHENSCSEANCSDFCFELEAKAACYCRQNYHLDNHNECVKSACSKYKKQCDSGECIPKSNWCDQQMDCIDGSDEKNCTNNCSKESNVVCHDGTCIQESALCDGKPDCPDRSDEDENRCKKCDSFNDWMCRDETCIPIFWRCDGKFNCADNSDEVDCHMNTCKESQMRCRDGKCISLSWVCDGYGDCSEGEDEVNCTCTSKQFSCTSGKCIDKSAVCDEKKDCSDGSDEAEILCNQQMVWYEQKCEEHQISCGSENATACIQQSQICDGNKDCPDNKDEEGCSKLCEPPLLKCKTQDKCIPRTWFCDTQEDCDDGYDEFDCNDLERVVTKNCDLDKYECDDGTCIMLDKICDGIPDCPRGTDEKGHCNACSYDNGGCTHVCHNHPKKSYCSCESGYELDHDKRTCNDIDECQNEFTCHQQCENTKGGFKCSCYEGYDLTLNNITCKPLGSTKQSLVAVFHNDHLELMNEEFLEKTIKLYLPEQVLGDQIEVDYDSKNRTFIILDTKNGTFYRQNKTGWQQLNFNVTEPFLLTVDEDRSNIYIAEKVILMNKTISLITLCSLTTEACKVVNRVIDGNLTSIISSSPLRRVYFCANTNDGGRIYVMDLEGHERNIELDKVLSCDALDVDSQKKRVYFADSKQGTIGSFDYLGHGQTELFTGISGRVSKLAYLYHSLLYQLFPSKRMGKCPFEKSAKCEEVIFDGKLLCNIHKDFDTVRDPCSHSYCDQLCVADNNERTCLCANGYLWNHADSICEKNANQSKIVYGLKCSDSPCLNGTCEEAQNFEIICKCQKNFSGKFCELKNKGSRTAAAIAAFLTLLALAIVAIVVYKKRAVIFRKRDLGLRRYRFWNQRSFIAEEEVPEPTREAVLA